VTPCRGAKIALAFAMVWAIIAAERFDRTNRKKSQGV
jgi:hypothetical protein